MESSMLFLCPYCCRQYAVPTESILLSHIRMVHSSDPDFKISCPADGCCRTFINFRTYQNHCLTHTTTHCSHESISDDANEIAHDMETVELLELAQSKADVTGDGLDDYFADIRVDDVKSFIAKWLLKTTETQSLTRTVTTGIVEDVSDLIDYVVQYLSSKTHDVLAKNEVDTAVISKVAGIFSSAITKPFEGLHSFHHQLQYYLHHFNLIVRNIP